MAKTEIAAKIIKLRNVAANRNAEAEIEQKRGFVERAKSLRWGAAVGLTEANRLEEILNNG